MTCSKMRESMSQDRIPISTHHLVATGKCLDDQSSSSCKRVKKKTSWFSSNQVQQQTSVKDRQSTPAEISSITTVAGHRTYIPCGGFKQKGSSIRRSFTYSLSILLKQTMSSIPSMPPLHVILRNTSHMFGTSYRF